MVTNSRAAARAGAIKPLNAPQPVSVQVDSSGTPAAIRIEAPILNRRRPRRLRSAPSAAFKSIRSDGAWIDVADIGDVWKITDEWWRGKENEIERVYYALVLEGGQRVTIFQDMVSSEWSRQAD